MTQTRDERTQTIAAEVAAFARPADRILDWGCGRGNVVRCLRDQGYDVAGADTNVDALAEGADLGLHRIRLDDGCRTDLPGAAFDLVFSQTVFEHVADLDATVAEIARVTAAGGRGYHVFPPKLCPIEPHLRMPLVHWLPKNRPRYYAIRGLGIVGFGPPHPPELPADATAQELARFQYEYSCTETFYRPLREIVAAFDRNDLEAVKLASMRPRVRSLPAPLRPPAAWAISTFMMVRLTTVRRDVV